jgi:hypothetical protein
MLACPQMVPSLSRSGDGSRKSLANIAFSMDVRKPLDRWASAQMLRDLLGRALQWAWLMI